MTPEESARIVADAISKMGLDKPDPSLVLANKLKAVDNVVMRLVSDQLKLYGFIPNKAKLIEDIARAYFEELKHFHEDELRTVTASMLAIRATEDL